uniref:Uncharacterized protein n=1 Tax=Avena sativa TaxID=4498 RepID=A0ACD5WHE3_AVESA
MQMMDVVLNLPKKRQLLTCILLWVWWTNRNKLNAGEMEKSTMQICHIIQKHVVEFQSTMQISPRPVDEGMHTPPTCEFWKKPGLDQVKVNFDVAFWEPLHEGAWGFVVRDDKGEFIAAAIGKLRHLRSALQAETEACVAAIEGAEALGLNRIIFESDCQVLVGALNSNSHDPLRLAFSSGKRGVDVLLLLIISVLFTVVEFVIK